MLQRLKNIYHFFVALAAVAWYRWPAKKLTLIGVTGTDGKTTTTTLIYHLLKTAGKKVAMVSSVAAYIGQDKIDTGFHVTSPHPWPLQKLLRRVADTGYQYLVLEVTSHGLDQYRILGCRFYLSVLTNITHEHLDYHKTLEEYIRAKSRLFKLSQISILNQDATAYGQIKKILVGQTSIKTYSLKKPLDKIIMEALNTTFPARYNQENALAAATAAADLGLTAQVIARGLRSFPGVPGRLETIPNNQGLNVIIDFAHTPNALKAVLTELRRRLHATRHAPRAKLIAVFGAAGQRDYTKRPIMGQVAAKLTDEVVLTAEDPRTEDVNAIIDQIAAGSPKFLFHKVPDRQEAINYAIIDLAQKGDIVGIFGKGHEASMCFGTTESPWSDPKAAKEALTKRKQS